MEQKQDIVLYQIDNANVCVSVFYKDETFWLTRMSMAELFGVGPQLLVNIWEIVIKRTN